MNAPLRCLIVDDVQLARDRLRRLLGSIDDIEILGEAANVTDALELVHEHAPDLIFLDIEMPERDGFALIAALPENLRPAVVFVTAYDQHAVRAFAADAIDYLLKPVEPERLKQAVERVRTRRAQWSPQLVAQLQQLGGESHYPDRLSLPVDHGIRLLALDDIDWIESAGNYLCIRTGKETLILRETLTKMETRLDPKRFARIHRSRIVNLSRVAKLLPLYNGDHTVVLKDSTELGLSRTYRDALYRALGIEH